MILVLLLLLQAAHVFGCGAPAFTPNTNRVVNGEDARPHSWPWQVSLQMKHGSRYHHTCGGSMVAPRWVMTAAHCIGPGKVYRVVLGEHDMSQNEGTEQIRDVLRIIVHPKWDSNRVGNGNDMALLMLDKAPIVNDVVDIACLPEDEEILNNDAECFITGWGNLYTHGPMPDRLQQARLPVVDFAVCSRSDWWGIYVKTSMVCAGGSDVSGCNGDSGGPLNCVGADGRWYVHGVTSFVSSSACNEEKKPTVFTRVSAFKQWINDIILSY